MAGHSHWANIQRTKGVADARRAKAFARLARAIQVAAKEGGSNPDMNLRLSTAIDDARSMSVPRDTIERSIKKGTGEIPGVIYEQVTYEGYGPGGVALMIEALTDNKNRAAADVRRILEFHGGNLGGPGCVGFAFQRKGVIVIPVSAAGEDQVMTDVLDAGAENMETIGDVYIITTAVPDFEKVRKALLARKYTLTSSELAMLPKDTVKVDEKVGKVILQLLDTLDDNDDIQKVYSNYELPESLSKQ